VTASASASAKTPSRKTSAPTRPRSKKKARPVVPEVPGQARIIAIANQKGGVGKSTTAVSLGAALADIGYRVLVVDLDPQGNASTGMGIRHEAREVTVYDVIVAEAPIDDAIVPTPVPHLDALPSTIDLAGAEIELVSQFSREGRLKRALDHVRDGRYDYILLDCPPSLGLLTVNAMTAAEELIVPIQCEYYALEGLGQLLRNVNLVQQNINPDLRLSGIVMTMFDPRTKLSEQVVAEVQRFFGDLVYDVIIPRTVRLSEAPGFGQPITVYDPRSKGAETYRELAREVATRPLPESPVPSYDDLPAVVIPATEPPPPAPVHVEEEVEEVDVPMLHDLVEPEPEPDEPEPEPDEPEPESEPGPEPASSAPVDDEELWEETEEAPKVSEIRTAEAAAGAPKVVVIDEDSDIDIRAGQEQPPKTPREEPAPDRTEIGATLTDDGDGKKRWRLFRKGGE
jgi:chromosome partitioning protein